MSQLKLLWSLQQHDRKLAQMIQKLKEIEKEKKTDDLMVKLQQLEYDIINKKTQKEVNELKIQRSSSKLEQIISKLKDVEEKLYDGSITDVKQLTYMNKEAQEIKKESIKLEKDVLKLMEETDKLGQEVKQITNAYDNLKEDLNRSSKEYEDLIFKLRLNIKREKSIIDKISSELSDELKKKYNALKEKKGKVLAQVVNGRCTGCHMSVPLSIICKVKNKEDITYCDNCGRILYYKENDNTN